MKTEAQEEYRGHQIQVFFASQTVTSGGMALDYSIAIDGVDCTGDVRELSNIAERENPILLIARAKQVIDAA